MKTPDTRMTIGFPPQANSKKIEDFLFWLVVEVSEEFGSERTRKELRFSFDKPTKMLRYDNATPVGKYLQGKLSKAIREGFDDLIDKAREGK